MKRALALLALALIFTSCIYTVRRNPDGTTTTTSSSSVSVSISFGVRVTNIITDFQPDRGTGATYRIGDPITLRLTSRQDGYVTLVIYNPFNYRNAEIRNIPVQRGTNIIPRNNFLTASAPTGVTRFRAFFTPEPNNSVSFTGGASEQYLDSQTAAYLSPYPVELRDVRETFLNVR
jgi:hypothetical protein